MKIGALAVMPCGMSDAEFESLKRFGSDPNPLASSSEEYSEEQADSSNDETIDNAFVPVVVLDKSHKNDGFVYLTTTTTLPLSPLITMNIPYPKETVRLDGEGEYIMLNFKVEKGNPNANDSDGGRITVEAARVRIEPMEISDVSYSSSFQLKVFLAGLEEGAAIRFIANDDDFFGTDGGIRDVFCGGVSFDTGIKIPDGYYYTKDGELLERRNESEPDCKTVYIIDKMKYDDIIKNQQFMSSDSLSDIMNLGIDYLLMIAFAAAVNLESGGEKDESYAIANVVMNFLKAGGSSSLKKLEDVVLYENSFVRGATQSNYTSFTRLNWQKQNEKHAIGAVVNAVGYGNRQQGYTDFSAGANTWDGIDLVSTKHNSPHRNYVWSEDSKTLLKQYKEERNGGVDVDKWTYKKTGYQIKATKIIGKTLYTTLTTGRGEHKIDSIKFQ
jgi:hypothetical protein